ncbi:MAG TPA: copper homeostasis protein CutC [Candidatus Acidoferrum sp.]|nr:copper homeostasis protein CutC [Candidatus Acidoferrum sp.]
MKHSFRVEISVESAKAAAAAELGGADRIELCAELAVGGLTPDIALMAGVRAAVQIPVFVMIRARAGNFVYSEQEFAAMCASIRQAENLGMNGVVLGVLTRARCIDVSRTRQLVELADGMESTFHRAIDESANVLQALEELKRTGITRVLTSGGCSTALEGVAAIEEMVKRARRKIAILPGAGIVAGNVREIALRTGATEFHAGLSTVVGRSPDAARFEEEVRRLVKEVRKLEAGPEYSHAN